MIVIGIFSLVVIVFLLVFLKHKKTSQDKMYEKERENRDLRSIFSKEIEEKNKESKRLKEEHSKILEEFKEVYLEKVEVLKNSYHNEIENLRDEQVNEIDSLCKVHKDEIETLSTKYVGDYKKILKVDGFNIEKYNSYVKLKKILSEFFESENDYKIFLDVNLCKKDRLNYLKKIDQLDLLAVTRKGMIAINTKEVDGKPSLLKTEEKNENLSPLETTYLLEEIGGELKVEKNPFLKLEKTIETLLELIPDNTFVYCGIHFPKREEETKGFMTFNEKVSFKYNFSNEKSLKLLLKENLSISSKEVNVSEIVKKIYEIGEDYEILTATKNLELDEYLDKLEGEDSKLRSYLKGLN